jgi:hypothetical protein
VRRAKTGCFGVADQQSFGLVVSLDRSSALERLESSQSCQACFLWRPKTINLRRPKEEEMKWVVMQQVAGGVPWWAMLLVVRCEITLKTLKGLFTFKWNCH